MAEQVAVGVIQARMGSTRLPGKVLLPLAGEPLLTRLVERVRKAQSLARLVVATGDTVENDAIAALCRDMACECHRGSESDVLARMLGAAGDASIMVRLTADNPFVYGALVDEVVRSYRSATPPVQYAANVENSGYPYGLFVEAAAINVLQEAAFSDDPMDREHVTWYIRRQPKRFRSLTVMAKLPFPKGMSLTIDTPEDYARLKPIFERLHSEDAEFGGRQIAALPLH